jgi:ankyrin repeat protein
MKIIITLFLLFSTTLVFGQTKDEQLYEAVTKSDSLKVETFLIQGANPNFKKKAGFFELSLLIWAAQHQDVKIVKLLIEYKAEVDWRDAFKTTALMYAVHTGNKTIVNLLLGNGTDPTVKDDQGNSVLSAAKESKNDEVIKLIESLQNN